MKCKFSFPIRDMENQITRQIPCGKCLPCRIKKRSSWLLRVRLEQQQSLSAQFWTLTLEDKNLQVASEDNHRQTTRNFFAALRAFEKRKGNPLPIRYYGCMEYGGRYGRPHWHLIIFNLKHAAQDIMPYRKGYPRTPRVITHWPYGLSDVCEVNPATINYVTSYVTDYDWLKQGDQSLRPHPYRTTRPAIGFYGISQLGTATAKKHSILSERPTFCEVAGRRHPMDEWSKKTFMDAYVSAGGIYRPEGTPRERHQKRVLEDTIIQENLPESYFRRSEQNERQLYNAIYAKKAKKEAKERAISARYLRLQDNKDDQAQENNQ